MDIEYDTGDWNKKITSMAALEINSDVCYGKELCGWDLDDSGKPHSVRIDKIWIQGRDIQEEMLYWTDDNAKGYFYQYSFSTEGGTPIIRDGDKFSITLSFQKEEDAVAFKLRWT